MLCNFTNIGYYWDGKGELAGLTWNDLDFKQNTISISRTRDEYGVPSPKTLNSIRTINMSEELSEHLKSFKIWSIEMKKFTMLN